MKKRRANSQFWYSVCKGIQTNFLFRMQRYYINWYLGCNGFHKYFIRSEKAFNNFLFCKQMHTTDLCSVCKGIQQIFIQGAKVIQNFVSGMHWLSTILNSECKGIQQFFVQDVKIQSWEFAHSLIAHLLIC